MAPPSSTKILHKTPYPTINPSRPELSCKDKVVIVTGAGAGGIGSAIVASFAQAGATKIAVLGRTEKTLTETKSTVESQYPGTSVLVVVTDMSKGESVGTAAHNIRAEFGAWDIFVGNAAYLPDTTTVKAADEDDWWNAFEVNVKSIHFFAKHFLTKCKPGATYISINAASAVIPASWLPKSSAYSASKAAAVKVDEFIAAENPDLRVFNLHPGIIETRMLTKVSAALDYEPEKDDPQLPGRMCVWLASSESEFLRTRYIFSAWDVDELLARKEEIQANPFLFRLTIGGFPFQ